MITVYLTEDKALSVDADRYEIDPYYNCRLFRGDVEVAFFPSVVAVIKVPESNPPRLERSDYRPHS